MSSFLFIIACETLSMFIKKEVLGEPMIVSQLADDRLFNAIASLISVN